MHIVHVCIIRELGELKEQNEQAGEEIQETKNEVSISHNTHCNCI